MSGSLGEIGAIISSIDPQDIGSTDTASTWASMANFGRCTAYCLVGAIDTTVDFILQQATSSGGAGAKTLKAATQLADDDDNKQVVISADQSDMDLAGGFTHVRVNTDLAAGTINLVAVIIVGFESRFAPTTALDETSVAEVVEA